MNVRAFIIAGCIAAAGLAACESKNEEPATVDTTATVADTSMPAIDTSTTKPVDTVLLQKTDTGLVYQDTIVKEGKTTEKKVTTPAKKSSTTTDKEPEASSTPHSRNSDDKAPAESSTPKSRRKSAPAESSTPHPR
jgi:hypothetical protein